MWFRKIRQKYIDLKLILILAAFYSVYYIVYIFKVAYLRMFVITNPKKSWSEILIHSALVDWVVVVGFMTLIAVSTKQMLNKKISWMKIACLHFFASFLIGVLIQFLGTIYDTLVFGSNNEKFDLKSNLTDLVWVSDLNFLIYFAMIFIIYVYYYFKQVKEAENQKSVLEKQLVNTRMKMLSSQLQPHFLFNTLNSISTLMEIDVRKSQDTIADLSDFLREILYNRDQTSITLKKELDILEYYLNIVNVRFSDHLNIKKDIDKSLLGKKVPALLFQPLIENAIKHGYSFHYKSLEIQLTVKQVNDKLLIKVCNNGKPLDTEHKHLLQKGFGMANINDRLENLYGEDYFFEMRNKEGNKGVETLIEIPLI